MGKATIISDLGEGLYSVEVRLDEPLLEKKIDLFTKALINVEQSITAENEKPQPDPATLRALEIRKGLVTKEKAKYEALLTTSDIINVWCADLTTGLSGEVATLEIGTERKNGINIRPGHNDQALWSRARDGIKAPLLGLSLYNATLNYCLMPAIQKYRPTYRYGTITGLNYDENTASVDLDACESSIKGIDINQADTLSNIPVEYMSCNAAIFELYDRVIVQFENFDQGSPKVIGFRDNPKSCGIYIKVASINGVTFENGSGYYVRISQPIPTQVTHASKGTYTEDFKTLGEGMLDSSGFGEIELDAGMSIDPDYPVNVAIRNNLKWCYYTIDWRGDVPDIGYEWYPSSSVNWNGVTNYPADWETGGFDFLMDKVYYVQHETVDLRTHAKETIQDSFGNSYTGFSIAFTGIKLIRRTHARWYLSEIPCQTNIDYSDYFDTTLVPRNFNEPLWFGSGYTLNTPISCYDVNATFQCSGGSTGEAFAHYAPVDSVGDGWTLYRNDFAINSDRLGHNPTYTESYGEVSIQNDFGCYWIWNETVGGYLCTNWVENEYVWRSNRCEPGTTVETGPICQSGAPPVARCTTVAVASGESMNYPMVDFTSENM
jgi:hypothetical protein